MKIATTKTNVKMQRCKNYENLCLLLINQIL